MTNAGEEAAKLHFINSLFADLTGHDLYLAKQVKAAIDSTLGDPPPHLRSELFSQAAIQLLEKHFRRRPQHRFSHWDCSIHGYGFSPLWARQELIGIFKKMAPYPQGTLLVTNLRSCICPPGKRWTRPLRREYAEAIALIQELARNWSTRRANLTLLFF